MIGFHISAVRPNSKNIGFAFNLLIFLSTNFCLGVKAQNFEIYHNWDFESEELGSYSNSEISEDFDINTLWTNHTSIVNDEINGKATKVLKVTHEANKLESGFDLNANLQPFDEIYLSYNIKFSEEFNSTQGGKMPGFQGSPNLAITNGGTCMPDDEGFVAVMLFKLGNYIVSYNYNRTRLPDCVWSSDEYEKTTVEDHYFLNGVWYNVVQRIRMNTFTNGVANADGINEIWVDGKLKIQEDNQIFNVTEGYKIDLLGFVSFYGGKDFAFMPQHECYTYFDNISVYLPEDDPVTGNQLHSFTEIINSPSVIADRDAFYDTFINKEGILNNTQYGVNYSPCIDEVYLIDAGAGNKVSVTLDWTIGGGDYLFFIDGKSSDSEIIRKVQGYEVSSNQTIISTGQYMLIRLSSNTDNGSKGFIGQVKFIKDGEIQSPNSAPKINPQSFVIKENEFRNNLIGRIIASDLDEDQALTYSIISGNENGIFSINSTTGEISTSTQGIFENEISTYTIVVKVSDNGENPQSNSAEITITFIPGNRNIYLDPSNKNDSDEDGSIQHPFDSWNDIIWTEGNNYLQKCGTTSQVDYILVGANYINIGSYGNGAKPVIESQTTGFVLRGFDKNNISINNLSIKGTQSSSLIYFLGTLCDNIIIENCDLESSVNAIQILDGLKFTIRYNTISAGYDGINTTARWNDIYYNIFKRNSAAIRAMGISAQANIYNNVFYDNYESVSATDAELTLYNNIFYLTDENKHAIRHESDQIVADHNIYYPEKEGFIEINSNRYNNLQQIKEHLKLDLHSYNSDPLFMDVYSDDFNIGFRSPAVNSGIPLNLDIDHSGNSVPFWGLPDIGAIEYTGIIPPFAQEKQSMLIIFPNPASDYVNVGIEMPESMISGKPEIRIIDVYGKNLLVKVLAPDISSFQERLDLSELSDGIYFIVFQNSDKLISEKIIIHR